MAAQTGVSVVTRFQTLDLVSYHLYELPANLVVDASKIVFDIQMHLNVDPAQRKVVVINPVEIFADQNREVKLGSISVKGEFIIENFEEIQVNSQLPVSIAATYIGVVLSSTRGMLKLMARGTAFDSAIIPILNPVAFLQTDAAK